MIRRFMLMIRGLTQWPAALCVVASFLGVGMLDLSFDPPKGPSAGREKKTPGNAERKWTRVDKFMVVKRTTALHGRPATDEIYKIEDFIERDKKVYVAEQTKGWYKIIKENKTAYYVNADALREECRMVERGKKNGSS